ncbi:hypothetical protein A3860_12495 [Niastella vici]|uniref:Uncharacterized protein n=1 Tax=Niastella vici TaxID=1703345 RepID=A0A1V9G775_9BACT|nr:hypothetical protein [Niastella vici]OQP66316.1 hypothetical protein A3860_12495 [Niastella vici]
MKILKFLQGLVIVIPILLLSHVSMAQNKTGSVTPSWITMMDDPNVNYFKAVEAFESYWKNREKPEEENEIFESAVDKRKEEELKAKSRRISATDPAKLYAFEYRKFLWWMKQTEPFVQPDGRIKSMDERIAEWKIQKQQKKEQAIKTKGQSDSGKKN